MAVASLAPSRLVLVDPSNPDGAREYGGLHAISPMLLGLAAPFVLLLVLAPAAFISLGVAALAILMLIMVAATIIFVHGLLTSGRIAAVAFDRDRRAVDIVETGTFSRSVQTMPFSEVSALRASPHYDRDGYRYVTTELVLRSGETLLLPVAPTEQELRAVRIMLAER